MGRLMIQNEAQGLGGALEHLLFLKISGDLVLATGRSLGTELVDLNTKRVTRIIGEGKPADALVFTSMTGGLLRNRNARRDWFPRAADAR